MLWDDEYENGYSGMALDTEDTGSRVVQVSEGCLDPTDIMDPASAYYLLSDDAQDEIARTDKKKIKCRVCGHRFTGEICDRCPECFSSDTEKIPSQEDHSYR